MVIIWLNFIIQHIKLALCKAHQAGHTEEKARPQVVSQVKFISYNFQLGWEPNNHIYKPNREKQ